MKSSLRPVTPSPGQLVQGKNLNDCVHSGCSNQLCVKTGSGAEGMTTCEWEPEFDCYAAADCSSNTLTGACEFVQSPSLNTCLQNTKADESKPKESVYADLDHDGCVHFGCSGAACGDAKKVERLGTTCEWRDEFACYQKAHCARNATGVCEMVNDAALTECLAQVNASTP